MNFKVSVKGFIVDKDGNLLVLKRESKDPHLPGMWEIPGGRLEFGENPYDGLKREIMEEIGLDVSVGEPLGVKHFTRQDGQVVTMIIFHCEHLEGDVSLSEEHIDSKWLDISKKDEEIIEFLGYEGFFLDEVKLFRKRKSS